MSMEERVPAAVRKIVELVRGYPEGITRDRLAAEARQRYETLPEVRLLKLVEQAVAAGLLVDAVDGLLTAAGKPSVTAAASPCRASEWRGRRFVALDVESLVLTGPAEPYLERHVYQAAAVRFGTDDEWNSDAPLWERHIRLACDEEEIRAAAVRERVRDEGVAPRQAWAELAGFVSEADVVIAYNGTGLDFPLVREAAARVGCEDPLEGRVLADGLYLAHAVWPTASSHRLHAIAEDVSLPMPGLHAHSAPDDAELLIRVLKRASVEVARWEPGLARLVAAVCADSPGWQVLKELAPSGVFGSHRAEEVWDRQGVSQLLGELLQSRHRPRRGRHGRAAVRVPGTLRGADGRVAPSRLAAAVHGGRAEPRSAQQRMADTLHEWTAQGVAGLLEAPTGTGKSYAVLAAALEWLAGAPERTAVIATFTKQLQNQMAADLKDLERAFPGILGIADLVKGQSSRLSLAALTSVLAEAACVRPTGRGRTRVVEKTRFRELAVYLLTRLRACTEAPWSWTARSVDPVDLPPFFSDYAGYELTLWLQALSQRDGDYRSGADTPLAPFTDTVREAISGHRLVLANHALVLAHLDDLRALGPEALLIVDEAHELENAATSALSVTADYRDMEDLLAECRSWLADARKGDSRDRVVHAVAALEELFDDERFPRLVARAFDARAKGVGVRVGNRTAVLASPYAGTAGTQDARRIQQMLVRVSRAVSVVGASLAHYLAEHVAELDMLVQERVRGLGRRAGDCTAALDRLISDTDALLRPAAVALDGTRGDAAPSRVVYLEELGEPEPGLRSYRFRIASSPIDLPADPEWGRYLESFKRVHYVSATLRVAGEWTFVRERLGLAEDLPALALPSPFNLARQAELVCFSDFPSWAEQEKGAMHTVAHQLAGYAEEMTSLRPAGDGHDGGAMVLTTARATAAGIGDLLERELRARSLTAPVRNALALGNGRAFAEFTDTARGGGFLVGTKGLWQGVDVRDEQLLRLVWINKLPFAPFAAPVIEARRAAVRERADEAGHPDPDGAATEGYYLPLAALQLRQAVGRLIRSERHRGVIVLSDRKLGGHTGLRRAYRRVFLGSLDEGLLHPDPVTREAGGGNVATMADGWRRIWGFMAREGLLSADRASELCTDAALDRHTLLPHTRRIRDLALTRDEVERLSGDGLLTAEVLRRAALVGGLLGLSDEPVALKPAQQRVIRAVAEGRNVLGLLPTGFGKSFTFQLPALVLPGVTIVISPLVALMHDQALELNRSIGGAVRALISPLRESSSRAGKTEVADQLQGREEHGIRLVYVSPERLCQRRFRELVRQAVARGTVTRIAVDEAHTMAQWEDFRPSMRRVGRFLTELREEFGLPVTAVTATANRSVHGALREGLFGMAPEPSAAGSAQERAEAARPARGGLVTVRENPIRPELAVFRRSLKQPGSGGVVGLAEQVVDTLDGHAIFYCLTVKEVNALHAHLAEYVGNNGVRVLRFHGRLTEAEKSAVMTEFRETPRQGAEGFAPVVTVATSAFGLGVNRPDVRTVFCVSPPTDLAALYQQIGRAGRDSTGRAAEKDGPVNTALALATNRGLRTVRFMTGQDLPVPVLRRMGQAVLSARSSLDATAVAEDLMMEDVAAGVLNESELRSSHAVERYRTGVMRAFSALADLGAVTDLGDYPPLCVVKAGETAHGRGDAVEQRLVSAVLAMPTHSHLRVEAVDSCLARYIDDYRDLADGPAGTWEILADLHDRGLLDVSAAPSRRLVTGLAVHHRRLPGGFLPLLARRTARAAGELALLKDFFEDTTTCAHRKFADYFGTPELPEGCCGNARCRCSACWVVPDWPANERRPAVAQAFESAAPQAGGSADSTMRTRRLDHHVYRLVRLMRGGIHPRMLWHALRGEEAPYHPLRQRRVPLPRTLRDSRHFGGRVDLSYGEVEKSLLRLAETGAASSTEDGRWHARRTLGPTAAQTHTGRDENEGRKR
ncbi:DEAD/DEAH box helicase [Streptomyces sp. UNOC14_S4]|uniref:DEAD/DEAH box helicase n=1 Tax=Streptomyces sp. UNOC14_S4 TaxID=2872340 RepID=UPI001E3095E4|nr:DEAD/DEAH box helicase [Streptomyces sp. UNOC14_S4]MCC3769569.1 DEAD/DEAH box helicase [Streptomyces sp. UNOC14_S4]